MSRSLPLTLVALDLLLAGCASQTIVAANPIPAPHAAWAGWSQVAADTGFLLASAPVRPQLPAVPKGPHYVLGDPYQFDGTWYRPQADYGYEESGLASIYDQGVNGQVTADGEIYSDSALTAAHKTLPLPSMVRVTNLDNGKSVQVRVNDRGPFVDNRVIQLSQHAGDLLGIRAGDAIRVHVEIMAGESQALAVGLGASGRDEIPSLPAVPSPKLTVQPLSAEVPSFRPEAPGPSPMATSSGTTSLVTASLATTSSGAMSLDAMIPGATNLSAMTPGAIASIATNPQTAAPTVPSRVAIGPQYASADGVTPATTLDQAAGARYVIGEPYQFDGTWYRPAIDYGYDATGSAVVYDSGTNGQATANGETYQDGALTAAHKTLPLPSLVQVTNLDNGRTATVRVNDRGPFADNELVELSRGAGAALGINPGDVVRVRVQIEADESRELASWFAAADRLKQNPPVLPGTDTAELPKPQQQVVIGPQFASIDGTYVPDLRPMPSPGTDSAAVANRPAVSDAPILFNAPIVSNDDELGVALDLTKLAASGQPVGLLSLQGQIGPATVTPEAESSQARIYVQAGAFRERANAERLRDNLADLGNVSLFTESWKGGEIDCVRVGPLSSAVDAQHMKNRLTDRGYRDSWVLIE